MLQFQKACTELPDNVRSRVPREIQNTRTSEELFKRNIQSMTNKLTPENFSTISQKVVDAINNRIEETSDPVVSLNTIVEIIFEKAVREPNFVAAYSDLCVFVSKNTPTLNSNTDSEVNFRRLLLAKCKKEFETKQQIPEPDASADPEARLIVEEARNKLIARNMGVPKFIGSLFLCGLLNEKVLHTCLFSLLSTDESDLQNFASLMTTVGKSLDHPKAIQLMRAYFLKVETLSSNKALSTRIRFKLKDLIDLRKNDWVPKRPVTGPKTIMEVHRDAKSEKQNKERKMALLHREQNQKRYSHDLYEDDDEDEEDTIIPPAHLLKRPQSMSLQKLLSQSSQTQPSQTQSSQTQSSQTQSSQTHSSQTQSSQTHSSQTQSSPTRSSQTQSSPTRSSQTNASQTQPSQTLPQQAQTQPSQTQSPSGQAHSPQIHGRTQTFQQQTLQTQSQGRTNTQALQTHGRPQPQQVTQDSTEAHKDHSSDYKQTQGNHNGLRDSRPPSAHPHSPRHKQTPKSRRNSYPHDSELPIPVKSEPPPQQQSQFKNTNFKTPAILSRREIPKTPHLNCKQIDVKSKEHGPRRQPRSKDSSRMQFQEVR